jgi:hypothetical protein
VSELNTIKPIEEEIAKHSGNTNVRQKAKIQWNDRSYQSLGKEGFDVPDYINGFEFLIQNIKNLTTQCGLRLDH